ncbi:bifunctional UDP-sugar hydrolase/5'-nucleotidase [Anaerolinea thermophila]|uniref:bifunctional metallophosphatase/5'-nucleotidase n=3 Tax=Anaerolinea TaxID=233189 RepID=UPI0026E9EB63|nr:5'-nucleotidase C-terminal domain-containing protein [Anaerolinea thermophila]
MSKLFYRVFALILVLSLMLPSAAMAQSSDIVQFTILHTNDFHGNLELSGSNPGAARVAAVINNIRAAKAALGQQVLLLDAGDIMQGSLLSNIQKGEPTIAYYKTIGYDGVTFGNHEFDWGQTILSQRVAQATTDDGDPNTKEFPFIAANIVLKGTASDCASAGWDLPSFVTEPYHVYEIPTATTPLRVGVIGVSSIETPYITIAEATAGLCFKDPADSILHYYDALDAASDVIVVLSHNGYTDGGYGYGFTVYGDQTLAQKLNTAGKPVNLIIGGHSHTDLATATMVGNTMVVQAHYAGRKVGQVDFTVNRTTGAISMTWTKHAVSTTGAEDPTIKALVEGYVNDPAYQALINEPIFYTNVPIVRDYNGNGLMGEMVNDAIYNELNNDAEPANDVDMVFNNPGGLRADITASDCPSYPCLVTYGKMFNILPFGNQTVVGEMTGAQIVELLNQSATLFKGALQVSGIRYKFYRYVTAGTTWAWGAYDIQVWDKATSAWVPIDANKTYRVATNEFLAPAGQDGFTPFKYFKVLSYWGDMLNQVNNWMKNHYNPDVDPTKSPYDRTVDGRIARDGDDTFDTDPIIPVTILHHNDSHGRLLKSGSFQGYTQLATIIKQERTFNPTRTLLLTAGDNIQGDSMMYYFKTAALGYAADGTSLPAELRMNPLIKAFNAMGYDAMTLGNHEFNFGKDVFVSTLQDANFPMLQANIQDDGSYGLNKVPVLPYVRKIVGPENIRVSILGIGNHRISNYELPSNIPGLTFPNPITTAQSYAPMLRSSSDVVIALTHIGFTENPASVEVDTNVDTYLAAQVSGLDAIIGGHSHTDPSKGFGPYKYLPTILGNPDGKPVLVTQAYRYNTYLGEVVLGLRAKSLTGGATYDVVSRTGKYISVGTAVTEDPTIKAIVDPYNALLTAYNNTTLGDTITPIDARTAYTEETNAANLQADASVWKLRKEGVTVDFHLSGAMTNQVVATTASPSNPVTLTVANMFTLMPYENSLVTLRMNGPQLKAVLERAYRNYYYYKYVPGAGGYSYYTTCMLDINKGGRIIYNDTYPALPSGNNVVALYFTDTSGVEHRVDFNDASKYYRVSTVNYLAAGSCNFNDSGVSLWPLSQIENDTQYYVRDAVIEYLQDPGTVKPINPQIEGRLQYVTPRAYIPAIFK